MRSKGADIRLGDVVVSQLYMEHTTSERTSSGFDRTTVNMPPTMLFHGVSEVAIERDGYPPPTLAGEPQKGSAKISGMPAIISRIFRGQPR